MDPTLGATRTSRGVRFRLYTTTASSANVILYDADGGLIAEEALAPETSGAFFGAELERPAGRLLYKFRLDGRLLPDPFARYLPQGVHGAAEVWQMQHRWQHPPLGRRHASELVIYELHVGTFTPEGTFEGVRQKLPYLRDLGVNAIELMPIAAFAGRRGWGYDGVALFAPHATYGTPDELCALVDAAHACGLAVLLDVAYNHFGPDGNYLGSYSSDYFTARHHTAWGAAPNYAAAPMRRLVLDNARYWLESCRVDGLRLDATHAIVDDSPRHILAELCDLAHGLEVPRLVIAEDERADAEQVAAFGFDAIWADAFHHQLHIKLTGERDGHYRLYRGRLEDLARLVCEDARGWHRKNPTRASDDEATPAEAPSVPLSPTQLVYCLQNHDQVGNRALGERLGALVSPEAYEAAATILLFLPMTPLLFMGQEWAASTPFLYFTDHEEELGRRIAAGRLREFQGHAAFAKALAQGRLPDPQRRDTFARSQLLWDERTLERHLEVLARYRRLLELRRRDPVLADPQARLEAGCDGDLLWVTRQNASGGRALLVNFGEPLEPHTLRLPLAAPLLPTELLFGRPLGVLGRHSAIIVALGGQGEEV
jgi:maltooligosyltrehalose trehalohydrolase